MTVYIYVCTCMYVCLYLRICFSSTHPVIYFLQEIRQLPLISFYSAVHFAQVIAYFPPMPQTSDYMLIFIYKIMNQNECRTHTYVSMYNYLGMSIHIGEGVFDRDLIDQKGEKGRESSNLQLPGTVLFFVLIHNHLRL